jgi:hypothetical protein
MVDLNTKLRKILNATKSNLRLFNFGSLKPNVKGTKILNQTRVNGDFILCVSSIQFLTGVFWVLFFITKATIQSEEYQY